MGLHRFKRIIEQHHVDVYDMTEDTWKQIDRELSEAVGKAIKDESCPATMELCDFFDEYSETTQSLSLGISCFTQLAHKILEVPDDEDFEDILAVIDICLSSFDELDSVLLDGLNEIKSHTEKYDYSYIVTAINNAREFISAVNGGFIKTRDGILNSMNESVD